MTTIKNKAAKYLDDKTTTSVRGAIEHRATWFCLLLNEARERGLAWDDFARAGIMRCGHYHGQTKIKDNCPDYEDMTKFLEVFLGEEMTKVLEAEILEKGEDRLVIDFHYCPLVAAWEKQGCPQEDIEQLCDIAMDGDRGIAEEVGFDLTIKSKIAEGADTCRIEFNKKK